MNQLTIEEIRKQLSDGLFSQEEFAEWKLDKRIGVQRLLARYKNKQERRQMKEKLYEQMLIYEKTQYQQGKLLVAGVDEVGRGPLAGPVVAAAVILNKDFYLPGLNDSKQLSKQKRENYYNKIINEAISYGLGMLHNDEIDQLNIYQATKKAMKKAIQSLSPAPDHVLIDAVQLEQLLCTSESIVKGDQKSISIAAASIVAKVTRDHYMNELHDKYPMYKFNTNSGYGTKDHIEAIKSHGITPFHRKSFAPIKELVRENNFK